MLPHVRRQSRVVRRRVACVLLALGVLISLEPGAAQQAVTGGANVNVISGTGREGDWTLQRQNEPSMACSSRNPRNCLAGANDYRTVDIPFPQSGDKMTGDAWLGWYTTKDGGLVWRTRLLPGFPQDSTPVGLGSPLKGYGAGADPVIRAGTNGLFYYTGLVFERTEGGASAIFVARFIDNNNQEGSDGEPIAYVGATLVDRIGIPQNVLARRGGARGGTPTRVARKAPKPGATNASSIISGAAQNINSSIVDKPWIAVDIPRAGAQSCTIGGPNTGIPQQTFPGGRVFLVYTRFDTPDEQRGRIMFSRSLDCGATWSPPRVLSRIPSADVNNDGMSTTADVTALQASLGRSCGQTGFNSDADVNNDCIVNTFDLNFVASRVGLPVPTQPQLSQGATIAVDPRNGALQVAWRQFRDGTLGDAIVVARSADGGATFSAPAVVANVNAFDQGTTDTSFRTNGFPTLAIDGQGRRYLAWTSRGFAIQRPDPQTGDARVVLSTSADGASWSAPAAVDNQQEPGHQIMPALAFAEGKLQLVYYDLREDISKLFGPFVDELPILNGPPPRVRHTMEVRAAQADPGSTPVFTSFRLTRYQFGSLPNSQVVQQLEFNPPNLPIFRAGTSPFMGDYLDAASGAPFVRNGSTWSFNTAQSGSPVFHAIWTDNRDVSPPANGDWTDYTPPNPPFQRPLTSGFDPSQPTPLPPCVPGQAGMRNQNIYTTRITQGLLVGALTNAKRLGTIQRSFPVFAQNNSTTVRSYRFTIANQPPGGEASFLQFNLLTTLDVQVPPKSTVARTVFVRSSDPAAQVRVAVNEIVGPGGNVVPNGQQGLIVLNPDPTNPDIANPDIANPDIANPDIANAEVTNPDIANPDIANPDIANPDIANPDIANPDIANVTIVNPDIANPDIANPDIANPDIANPDIANPDIANADLINGSLSDTTWTFQNKGNTGGSFTIKLALNRAVPAGFKTQLIAHKVYQTPAALGCVLLTQPQTVLLSNIPNPTFVTANELANPDIANPDIANLTIALGPGETARITLRTLDPDRTDAVTFRPAESVVTAVVAQAVNTEQVQQGITQPTVAAVLTTEAPTSGGSVNGNYSTTMQALGDGTWTLAGGNLPPGLSLNATTGEVSGTPTASGVFTFTLKFTATSGLIDYKSVTITISSTPGADLQLSAPAPVPVPVGSELVYTINAGNNGPDTANNVVLTDTLPEGVSFLNVTTTRGSCLGKNGSVVCNLGTLLASQTATIVITVKPNTTGPHVNSVQLTATQADPVISNNVTSTTTSSPAFGPCAAPCFSGPASFAATAGNGGFLMETADFNEDGVVDLVYSSAAGTSVAVLRGDGAGGFLAPQQLTTPGTPQAIAVGDFNGDDNIDLFVGAASGTQAWLFLGNGSGGFGSAITVNAGVAVFHPVAADFNSDGNLDIVAGGTSATTITTLLLGNGDGTFAAPATINTGAAGPVNVVLEDFNSDGKPDVALSNRGGTTIAVLLGDGAGGFTTANISIGASPRVRKAGDLTGDGLIDLLVVDSPSANVQRTQLLAGNGAGGFASPVNINADPAAFYAAPADVDGDGDLDLIAIRIGAGFTVQVNDGAGGFGTPILWPSVAGGHVLIGDFNRDGAPDVAIAGTTPSRVLVFLNTCGNSPADLTLFQTDAPDPVAAGGNVTYSITVINNGPNPATNVQVSDALGTGAANATFVSATSSQGSCTHSAGLVVCQLGTLPTGGSATMQIVVTANGAGTLSNVVGVTAATSDPNPGDNSRTSATVVNGEVAPLVVVNTNDAGAGSLRQAIVNANATTGPADTITFNIPGPGPHTIALASALPTVSQPAIIDATTQPGYSGTPLIELNGANAGTAAGLVLTGGSTVRGLAINRFTGAGIILQGSGSNVVQANRIGTNPAGTTALPNSRGIFVFESPNNTIGGNTANDRNLISGNTVEGIGIQGTASANNVIQGNFVGTDAAGTAALGNGLDGIVLIGALNNTIGGTASGQGNVIAFNAGSGVRITAGTGNAIASNRIFSNGALGIDLGEGGVTPNDAGDGDAGANNLQNFPVLAPAAGGVQGTLNSTASRTFRIEFFGNSACDASGNGEGATFLGTTSVSTGADGNATIPFFSVAAGQAVTATATDTTNNTSEFSACVNPAGPASANLALTKGDAPDPIVQGNPLTYTLTVTNNGPDAATNVTLTDNLPGAVSFVSATPSQGSCSGTTTVSCSLGTIANGSSATVTIVVTATSAGVLTNSATVASAQTDPAPANNAATTTTTVTNPAAIFTVTTTANAGPGSLRQAILDANANTGGSIVFNIPAAGVQTISPTTALPALTAPISIDGTSQPGFGGVPLIEISGASAGAASGLVVAANNVLIRGLIINRFASANGILLQSGTGAHIEGNYLGTNAAGTSAAANANGITILSSGATIGGLTASARNVLSGNTISGLQIVGNANVAQGNLIGTNAAGTAAVANSQSGVLVTGDDNVIGGTTSQARNVISGNTSPGVFLTNGASGNFVQGNAIGTNPAGTVGIPNGVGIVVGAGISVSSTASSNTIGGTVAGAANVIAFNTGVGVSVGDGSTNNAILRNTIFSNGALGIDLHADGVTPNDAGDPDGGANDRQNFPVLTAVAGGVQGTLNSTPNSQFRIEFFSSPSCDASGNGEGALFLGTTNVTTSPIGDATIPFFEVAPNQFVTATATDGSNNTSEFSSCVGVSAGTPVVALVNPASGQQGQTLNVVVTGQNTNFVNGTTTASFGAGIAVNSTTVTSPTQATVNITISPIATTGSRTVTMNTGSESAQSEAAVSFFAVTAGPAAISGLSPNTAQQNQILNVVITGSNTHFAQGTSGASFGSGVTVNSLTVASSTSATANITIAAGAALGARTVTVTTAGETATIVNGFTVQAGQASIANVSPNTGRQAQKLDVTVNGSLTGFIQGTTTASFGPGITTNSVTVTNATTATVNITIAVGASLGSRTVTMTTGSEVASLPGGFTVLAGVATITDLTPTAGIQGQNLTVIITGAFTNFTQGVTAANFGPGISVGSVTVNGPTLASVPISISAGATVGLRTVTVTTGTESASFTNGFNVLQGTPTVTSINPNVGRQNQTVPVVINGLFTTWTTGTTRVSFGAGISVGGAAAGTLGPVQVQSSTQVTANLEIDAAAALGVRDVTIQTGAEVIVVTGGFTVSTVDTTNPTVLIFSPAQGATDVPLNAEITVEFNEPMNRDTVTTTTMRLLDNITGQVLPSAVSVDPTGRIAKLVPSVLMAVNRGHQVALTGGVNGIKDQSGNPLGSQSAFFTTGFSTNTAGPAVLIVNPRSGDTGIPLNTRVSAQFDKPINPVTRPAGFRVTQGGVNVPGTYAFSDNNRRLTFTPAADLIASTSYAINITAALSDAAGNQVSNPQVVPFTTGAAIDSTAPQSTAHNPEVSEIDVPTNVVIRVFFSEPINPMTVTTANFRLFASPTSQIQPATAVVAPDRRSATLTPIEPLRADTTYFWQLLGTYQDIAGNTGPTVGNVFFTTGGAADNTPPTVIQVTPTPGATNVQVNSRLVFQLSEPIDDVSAAIGSVQLTPSIAGTLTIDEVLHNNVPIVTATFVPSSNLAPSTLYTVQVNGWRDRSGNQMAPFSTTFTTSASATADTTPPIATVQPANNATNVPQNAQIQITVNEPIVPATITHDSIFIRQESGSFARMAGTFSVNATATVITFTPAQPYPAGLPISVRVNNNGAIRDLAGNQLGFVFSQFTATSEITDTVGPTVTSITPADGTVDSGANPRIVLTFSESLNPNTVNTNTFAIFAGPARFSSSPQLSADNRTVVISGVTLPQNTLISVVATSGVTDLAGNPLADFHSTFTTGTAIEADRPSIVVQRPASGATGVPAATTITLYANSPLDPATVPDAVRVSQNGILVEGVATVSASGEAIHFVPAGSFTPGALVQIFVEDTATDLQGNPLFPYSGQLTIQSDPLTSPPQVLAISPFHGQTGVPTNVVAEVRFSEPLDPSTVTVANISLRNNQSVVVPSTITLIDGGRTVRLVPSSPLAPNQSFHVAVLTGLEDAQNTPVAFAQSFFFNTGAANDTVAPTVTAIMPPPNETGVGVNALLRLTFSEAINRISIRGSTVKLSGGSFTSMPASISFSTGVGGVDVVTIAPLEPLPENTVITIDVNGVTDLAGRAVVPFASQFTTGTEADTERPFVAVASFPNGAVDVPLNAVFTVEMNEPIDGQTMTVDGFRLVDQTLGTNITATRTLSADGRTLTLAPSGPLAAGRSFSLIINTLEDMAGNAMFGTSFFFTTTFTPDTNAPTVVATTPSSGATGVPRNATLAIRFSEPITSATSGVRLLRGATQVPVTYVRSDANRVLELLPATLLAGNTAYTLSIQGVRDQSGNVLAGTVTVPFTTAGGADLVVPVVVATNPQSGDTDVPRNVVLRATFSERINPLSPGIANWRLFHSSSGQTVPATRAVSSDLRTVTLTPLEPLLPSTAYNGSSFQVEDLAGNQVGAFIGSFTTGNDVDNTAPGVQSISPVSSATNVPVNARVVAVFNEKIDRTSVAAGSVTLTPTVPGAFTLATDERTLTFTPSANLTPSTGYTVQIAGFRDRVGTLMTPFASSFTTSAVATPDTTPPTVTSTTPANNASGVPVTSPIVLNLSERINAATVDADSIFIRQEVSPFGRIAGTYSVNSAGTQIVFTPAGPYPAATTITVRTNNNGAIKDVAGNTLGFSFLTFTTANTVDDAPPTVLSITPADGTTNVGTQQPITLVFSESLNPNTVNTESFAVFAGAQHIGASVQLSSDTRVVTILATLPSTSSIAVVVTDGVEDLSGNPVTPFLSEFQTGLDTESSVPFITSQRPASGASNVPVGSSIVLFASEPLDVATVAAAVHVTQNGVPISGSIQVSGGGRAIHFTPSTPFPQGALIGIAVDSTAKDLFGNGLSTFASSFVMENDIALAPAVEFMSPAHGATNVPINTIVDVRFSEPMNPATLTASTISLRNSSGVEVPTTIAVLDGNRRVRLDPVSNLSSNSSYFIQVTTGVQDAQGTALPFTQNLFFATGAAADSAVPTVVRVSPPNGTTGVGANAVVRVAFSEPINGATVTGATITLSGGSFTAMVSNLAFNASFTEVVITPLQPLPSNTTLSLAINGVQDLAGNAVPPQTTTFQTGDGVDSDRPVPTFSFINGVANMPINSSFTVTFNEAIVPQSVTETALTLRDQTTGLNVEATISFSSDLRRITLVPNSNLTANRAYTLIVNSIQDLAANVMFGTSASFVTGSATDTTAPTVVAISPPGGGVPTPINSAIQLWFSESIRPVDLGALTLRNGSAVLPLTSATLSNNNRLLTITPSALLRRTTSYTLELLSAGVTDTAGNPLPGPVQSFSFSTNNSADVKRPSITGSTPANGAINLPTTVQPTITFSEAMNPVVIHALAGTGSGIRLQVNATGVEVPVTFAFSANFRTVTIIPLAPLAPNTQYVLRVNTLLPDLAGNALTTFLQVLFTTQP